MASARSLRGLDWLNFFVANVQTGFGPFIAVYLTGQAWTQQDIGFALSVGTATAMLSQVPAGALVDATRSKRLMALLAIAAISASALIFTVQPAPFPVMIAEILHGFASCMLSPAIAAISLLLVGHAAFGDRLGRNARFAAVGNGLAAGIMGAAGAYVSGQSVFILTAALAVPGLLALRAVRGNDLSAAEAALPKPGARHGPGGLWRLVTDRRLLVFAACCALFHLSNAAMLPLAGSEVTLSVGSGANIFIAASIVLPQFVVAAISPWVGHDAERRGRRPILMIGFAMLPLRGLLLATITSPAVLVMVQALDGVSGAVFGVLLPLVAADITRGTSRFNLCMGMLGLAIGIGATLSTTVAGIVADQFGREDAFFCLAAAGLASVLLLLFAMPETRPNGEAAAESLRGRAAAERG